MAGKTLQKFVDIISELRAGVSVHYVAKNQADAEDIQVRVAQHVTVAKLSRFRVTISVRRSPTGTEE